MREGHLEGGVGASRPQRSRDMGEHCQEVAPNSSPPKREGNEREQSIERLEEMCSP